MFRRLWNRRLRKYKRWESYHSYAFLRFPCYRHQRNRLEAVMLRSALQVELERGAEKAERRYSSDGWWND